MLVSIGKVHECFSTAGSESAVHGYLGESAQATPGVRWERT